ncbi:MAG: ParB N-terminal domain-containing protein [Nanoarchaeota archaeon]|nr:ParB N-terminal domain-containing protein [Nanoarchaeota archaeon]
MNQLQKKQENEIKFPHQVHEESWEDGFINFDLFPQFEDSEFRKLLQHYAKKDDLTFPLGFEYNKEGEFFIEKEYIKSFPLHLITNSAEINARGNTIHLEHAKRLGKSLDDIGLLKPITLDPVGRVPEGGHREFGALSIGAEYIPAETNLIDGGKISAMADSQVHYADQDTVVGVCQGFSLGHSIETLAAATSKSPRTIRFFVNLLNATPELLYGVRENLVSLTHACELARLNKQDQLFELKLFLESDVKLSARKLRKKVTAGIKLSNDNPTLEDLQKMKLSRVSSKKKFEDLLSKNEIILPTYEDNFKLTSDEKYILNLDPVPKETKQGKNLILQRLALLYNSEFISTSFLDNLESRLESINVMKNLSSSKSLSKLVSQYSSNFGFKQTTLSSEDAYAMYKELLIEGKSVLLKYPHRYEMNADLSQILPSPVNVRGTRKETIQSAQSLVPSIKNFGVCQAILCHINKDGHVETIVGNRRYEGSLLAKSSTIPACIVERTLSKKEILLIQLIEDSQKTYTVLERASRLGNNYRNSRDSGMSHEEALNDVKNASNLSLRQLERYLLYDNSLSPQVKTLYSFSKDNFLKQDYLDELVNFEKSKQQVLVPISIFRSNYDPNKFQSISQSIYDTDNSLFSEEVDTNLIMLNEATQFVLNNLR